MNSVISLRICRRDSALNMRNMQHITRAGRLGRIREAHKDIERNQQEHGSLQAAAAQPGPGGHARACPGAA